jgi:cytochrome c5
MRNCVPVAMVLAVMAVMVLAGCPGKPEPETSAPARQPAAAGANAVTPAAAANETSAAAVPAVDAKALYETKCKLCHKLSLLEGERMTAAGWTETVKDMASKKAGWISETEATAIAGHLVATYPK